MADSIVIMSKLKPGDRVTIKDKDRSVTGTVRRVGCSDPDCPSCEGHWREVPVPARLPN